MPTTNVKLSKEELALVANAGIILTKNRIIAKAIELFGFVYTEYEKLIKSEDWLLSEVLQKTGKIYKGEQYKSLPYVMLDYPRHFSQRDVFAIRSFFWWGNFFSITLHLSGRFARRYAECISDKLPQLENTDLFICINESEWEHHFEEDNYLPVSVYLDEGSRQQKLREKSFIKLSKKIPVKNWDDAFDFFVKGFRDFVDLLK